MAQEAGCFHDRVAVRMALEAAGGRVAQVPPPSGRCRQSYRGAE